MVYVGGQKSLFDCAAKSAIIKSFNGKSMFNRESISFKTEDNLILRGWFYSPKDNKLPLPCVIMTHGFSALKEHYLAKFAEVFVTIGLCVLIYDNRNFGESEGQPRLDVNPELQARDLSDAITYLTTKSSVDSKKIGLWGTSFSAGNVVVTASFDKRVKCIVAQNPFVKGHHDYLKITRPELWSIIQKKYSADEKGFVLGKAPMMTPVVTNDPTKSVVMKEIEAYNFFTSVAKWENQVTLRSVRQSGDYAPVDYLSKISVPILWIIADHDTICISKLAFDAYEKINAEKKCVIINGHHFSAYHEQFEICVNAACEWFSRWL